jgi:hypothetical protein
MPQCDKIENEDGSNDHNFGAPSCQFTLKVNQIIFGNLKYQN